jgi:hypothetical protein
MQLPTVLLQLFTTWFYSIIVKIRLELYIAPGSVSSPTQWKILATYLFGPIYLCVIPFVIQPRGVAVSLNSGLWLYAWRRGDGLNYWIVLELLRRCTIVTRWQHDFAGLMTTRLCSNWWHIAIQPLRSVLHICGVKLKCDGTRWRTGGEVKGKLANGVGSQYSSHYFWMWCIQHYCRWCAHLGCQ